MKRMEQLSADGAMPVIDLLAFLEGNWGLSRTINDLRQNMPGAMTGRVEMAKRTDIDGHSALAYREEGELRFGDYRETVFRYYDFSFPSRQKAIVHFTDGRLFHDLDLSSGFCAVEHLCADDTYRGRFHVQSRDVWLSNWFISGPSKELVLDNRYQRLP
jgi:hypothetical protein